MGGRGGGRKEGRRGGGINVRRDRGKRRVKRREGDGTFTLILITLRQRYSSCNCSLPSLLTKNITRDYSHEYNYVQLV